MEILSDTTFKGDATFNKDVTISGGDFYLFGAYSDNPLVIAKHDTTEFLVNGVLTLNNVDNAGNSGTIYLKGTACSIPWINVDGYGKSYIINFPRQGGTLALTSDIASEIQCALPPPPDLSGFLKYKKVPIDFDVPADCTKFSTSDGTGIPLDKVISLNLFKSEVISIGNGRWPAIKQVQADVWAEYCGGSFIVEKSSAFSISPSDGYEIRAAYYE